MPEFVNPSRSHGLVDILDRVLDKGLVVAGDIKINLANVELLTIQVRLLVDSIESSALSKVSRKREERKDSRSVRARRRGADTFFDSTSPPSTSLQPSPP